MENEIYEITYNSETCTLPKIGELREKGGHEQDEEWAIIQGTKEDLREHIAGMAREHSCHRRAQADQLNHELNMCFGEDVEI